MLREISGVTQVENGYAGNTAVATVNFMLVKHGHRSNRTRVPADYYLLMFDLNVCYLSV